MAMRRCFDYRDAVLRSVSPTERVTYSRWKRGVATFYASIALLVAVSCAYLQYRVEGTQNQTVNLRALQIN